MVSCTVPACANCSRCLPAHPPQSLFLSPASRRAAAVPANTLTAGASPFMTPAAAAYSSTSGAPAIRRWRNSCARTRFARAPFLRISARPPRGRCICRIATPSCANGRANIGPFATTAIYGISSRASMATTSRSAAPIANAPFAGYCRSCVAAFVPPPVPLGNRLPKRWRNWRPVWPRTGYSTS